MDFCFIYGSIFALLIPPTEHKPQPVITKARSTSCKLIFKHTLPRTATIVKHGAKETG